MWNTRIKTVTVSGTQGAQSLQLLNSFQQRGRSRLQIHLMVTTDELVFIMWFLKHSNSIFFFRSVCTMFKWLTRKLSSRYCKIFLLLCYWPWCFPNLLLSFAVVSFTEFIPPNQSSIPNFFIRFTILDFCKLQLVLHSTIFANLTPCGIQLDVFQFFSLANNWEVDKTSDVIEWIPGNWSCQILFTVRPSRYLNPPLSVLIGIQQSYSLSL